MEKVVLQGLAAFRWAAWLWMVVVLAVSSDRLHRPNVAVLAAAVALVVTVWATLMVAANAGVLLRWPAVVVELAVGVGLVVLDGVVAAPATLFTPSRGTGAS